MKLRSKTKSFNESYFHDDLTGYLVGNNGTVLRSENFAFNPATGVYTAGSWTSKAANDGLNNHTTNANLNITSIAFSDRYSGFIGGDYNNSVQTNATADYARRLNDESNYFSTRFWYDKLGRIVVSQNSRQYVEQNGKRYSYTTYDVLGRVEEAGEKVENTSGSAFASVFGTNVNNFYNPKVIDDANLNAWINNASGQRTEVTHTYYDEPNATIATALPGNFTQENLRKRVSCVVYEEVWDNNDATYSHATHYTYDIHGNVNTLLQDNPNTGVAGQEFKRLDYEYDLISGNVNEVAYQEGQLDMMIHRYEYDADNRITSVETSTDGVFFDNDAKYFYYAHGPLARTELGENQVQGLDYVYTLQGWIKGVNSNTLDSTRDVGQDGDRVIGNPNAYFAKDVFGYTLNYFNGDYTAINGAVSQTANNFESDKTNSDLLANRENFFNGNISAMVTTITNPTTGEILPQGMAYDYDQLNRLLSAKAFVNLDMQNNVWQSGSTYANRYYNAFSYDANGNIRTQTRYAENGTQIEDMTYQYNRNTNGKMLQNRLYHVNDNVAANAFTDDIDDQGAFSSANVNTANNYGYDGEGRLIRDDAEEIAQINWTVTGKVKEVIRTSGSGKKNLKFRYDAMGQRIAKEVYDANNNWEKTTFYILDAQGLVMSIYDKTIDAQTQQVSYKVVERDVYGSARVGLNTVKVELIGATNGGSESSHITGKKQYEISNHLGNVISIVTDKVLPKDWDLDNVVDYFRAEIVNASDYTPFGVQMDGRTFEVDDYRYGFNGMEKTNEFFGDQSEYTTQWRQLDVRLGRWFSRDPKSGYQLFQSPYCAMDNNPIICIDPDGDIVDKGKFWSKEGFNNRVNHVKAWIVSGYYRDLYKKRKNSDMVYKMKQVDDNTVPILQDGGKVVNQGDNLSEWQYTKGFFIEMNGSPPESTDQPCSDDCVPAADDNMDGKQDVGARKSFLKLALPKSVEATYRVTPDATIDFYPLSYNDRIRIYSGGKKIYDSKWVKKKPMRDATGKIMKDEGGNVIYENSPRHIELGQYFDSGQIQCNTIKVKVTSGFDVRTQWLFNIHIPGNCNK